MKNEIKVGAILGYVNMALNIIVAFVYTPIMLKLMGQSEYGLYSLVTSVIAYFSVLDMGFGNAMIRFVSRSQAKGDNKEKEINGIFLFLYSLVGIIAIVLGMIVLFNINNIFSGSLTDIEIHKAKILFIVLLVNVSLSFPLSVFDSYVTANEKFTFIRLISVGKTFLKPLIMLPLLLFGYKSIAMALVVAILNIIAHIITLLYSIFKLKIKFKFDFRKIDFNLLKDIGSYSFFILLNIIVDNIFNNTDQIILGIVSGTVAVSIYSVANQIVQMNTQFSTIISGLFLPRITKIMEKEDSDIKISNLFLKVSRIQLYIMLLILSGFIIFGKKFIVMWAGEEYISSYYIILLLITPSIIPLTQNLGISVIQAKNIHQFRSIMYVLISILNIFLTIFLSKLYQGIGAAIGTAVANILGQIITMNIFYYKKAKLDIPRYWKNFIKLLVRVLLLVIPTYIIVNLLNINIVCYFLTIILYTLMYFIIILTNMNFEEKIYIQSFFKKVFCGKEK